MTLPHRLILMAVLGLAYSAEGWPRVDASSASAATFDQSPSVGHRIVLMLQKDVGQVTPHPIDPLWLKRLSQRAGMALSFEANTRTNGQILSVPLAVTRAQAQDAAERLSLEAGVLWADLESGGRPSKRMTSSSQEVQSESFDEIHRFIVKLRGDVLSADPDPVVISKLAAVAGQTVKVTGRTTLARILSLEVPLTPLEAETMKRAVESLSEVVYADPDRRATIQTQGSITPNDPGFPEAWHLLGPSAYQEEPLPPYIVNGFLGAANVQAAWALTRGRAATGVAVVDSGILFDHPDLKRSLGRQKKKRGWDMVSSVALARDGNARDSDAQDEGNWVNALTGCGTGLRNSDWHGSHVAGIVAATTNNRIGVSGVNWRTKLVPVRAMAACGGNLRDLADGILWAAGHPDVPDTQPNRTQVTVINFSVGGYGASCPEAYQEAIDYALSKGISFVAAAGNDSKDVELAYPANCRGVISVAAVNHLGDLANYSNFGPAITLSAPGGQIRWPINSLNPETGVVTKTELDMNRGILSTINTSTTAPREGEMSFGLSSGTSMAAPVVSGVISLMYAVDSKHRLNPVLVKKILVETAQEFFKFHPTLTVIEGANPPLFNWAQLAPNLCDTSLIGQCGAGIIDAKAAVQEVLDLQ